MSCPEGEHPDIITKPEEEQKIKSSLNNVHAEGVESLDLNTYKSPKTWKKSITNFLRHQLRSTKSNDGDHQEVTEEQDVPREQKWQSLGKMFRKPSVGVNQHNSSNQQAECSCQTKKISVKKVISSYFGKSHKSSASSHITPREE